MGIGDTSNQGTWAHQLAGWVTWGEFRRSVSSSVKLRDMITRHLKLIERTKCIYVRVFWSLIHVSLVSR